jgi:hypothetical protein
VAKARFTVRDPGAQQLAYVYFEEEPGWRLAANQPRFLRGGNRDSNNGLGIVDSVLMLILAPLASHSPGRDVEITDGRDAERGLTLLASWPLALRLT